MSTRRIRFADHQNATVAQRLPPHPDPFSRAMKLFVREEA
jgi:hypothetical protein